jgi:DNA repair exonuclease SbcCD ATPase subunit
MELDSLELKVSAEAQSAEKALDSLIGKLQSFSEALGGINTTSISKNLENLAKVGGLKTITKEVEDLGKTVDNVGKKKTKTEVKVDVKQGLEAIKELQSKFSNIGKGTQFNGNLSSLEKEYDKLSAKLDKLAEREQKALAIGTASTNDKAFQSLQYDIANTINKLAELETKIQSVKNQNTSQTANIPIFRWDNQNTGSTQNITENIEKSLKSIPETAKYSVEQAQKSLNEAISKVQNAQTNVEDFSQRISQARANLKNVEVSGKGMGTDEWDRAYIALQKVVSEAKQYKAALNERATGINTDISETDSLDTKVNKLREDLKQLKADGFGFGDTAFDKTYQQLNQAEKELAEYKARLTESENSTRSFGSTLKSAATGFSNFIGKIKNAGAATLNFAKNVRNMKSPLKLALGQISKLGNSVARLYFKYMMLSRVAGVLGKVLGISSDYVEEYNYFQKAIDKIAQENKGNYKKYGYDDAKSYADSFEDRLTTLTGKMTGYKIGKDGDLLDTGTASLGLDITQITNFEAQIAQMTNSVGMMGEASIATSKAMTMLAGDMSSLTNMPLDTVMKNFSSGLSGAAMAVKKYGMDISVAALQETALGLGVKKNVSDMTQAEKEYLRVITMLQQSKVAWGDLADTINQPANQFRMLKSNIKQCGLMLSRLFMPVIEKVLPWLNAMAMAVKDLMKHIGDLFGLKFKSIGGSSNDDTSSSYDDVSDSADNAADSINNAADAQKKFNKQLQGFDKLNNLTTNETSKGGNDSDKGNTGDTSGVLSDALINAVEDYEKRWNKAFKSMTSDADKLKEKIEKLFTTAWDTGDGTEIGEALATTLNKGIDYVNEHQSEWSSGLNKITSIMGTTLNGFIKKFEWKGLGQAIGGSIKTALEAETNFFETVNWVNLGKGLSKTLNSAIKTGVLQSYFKSMASKLRAAIETAFGAITTFDFKGLGNALGQGINDFFKTMNKKNKQTGLNGWQELGKSLSDGIKGIADTLTTALKKVKWEKVGQSIGDFISAIDFGKVTWSLLGLAKALVSAIGSALKGSFSKAPIETGLLAAFALVKYTGIGKFIAGEVSKKMAAFLAEKMGFEIAKDAGISTAIKTGLKGLIAKAGLTSLSVSVGVVGIAAATAALVAFYNYVESKADEKIKLDMSEANKALGDLNSSAKECEKAVNKTKDALKKVEERDENAEAKGKEVENLASAYYKLSKKVNKTKAEKATLKKMSKELSKEIPGLKKNVDKETGAYKGSWKQLKKLVEKTKEYYKAKAAQKDLADIGDKLYENEKKLAEAAKKSKQAEAVLKNERINLVNQTKRLNELEEKNLNWKSGSASMTKSEYTEMEKLRTEVPKLAQALQDQEEVYKDHKKELGALKDTQQELNEKYNTASDYVEKYTKKVDSNTTSTSKQKDAIKGVGEETDKLSGKKATVSINSKGVKKTKEDIESIKGKTVKVTANAKKGKDFDKVKKEYNSIKTRNANINVGINGYKKLKEIANNPLLTDLGKKQTIKRSVEITFKMKNQLTDSVSNLLSNLGKNSKSSKPKKKAKGGIFENGSWHNITKYANGGMPNMGQLFVAREKGPELVSTLKGHTAVMNNDQIVTSVSQGVSDAVYNVMTPVLTSLVSSINRMSSSGTPLYVEGVSEGDIVKITQNANADYKKRYGRPLFT